MLFDYCFILCPYFSLRDVSQFALKHLTAYLRHQVYEQATVEMAHLVLHHTRVELVELLDLSFLAYFRTPSSLPILMNAAMALSSCSRV